MIVAPPAGGHALDPIATSDIAAAERLAGVTYTPAERDLMRPALETQLRHATARRAVEMSWHLGPATRFDPRLADFIMPAAEPVVLPPVDADMPETEADIAFATVGALSHWIRTKQLSCERLTRTYLTRISRFGPKLSCFALLDAAGAIGRARALDRMLADGVWLGPLHGIPYGAKDILDTAGLETAWGAETHRGRIPTTDAAVVRRLREAGAVMLGKTTVGALAYGDIWYDGVTKNPWNLDEGSSGSSAGSGSAVAAGLVGFALGTETLGSIVCPSARCGVTGLRPTFGRVPRTGAMPLCWTLDKIGPMTRSVADAVLVLRVLNGPEQADPFGIDAPFGVDLTRDVTGLRLGWFPADFEGSDAPDLDRAALGTARRLGMSLVELARPVLPYDSLLNLLYAESAASFEDLTLSNRDDELVWQDEAAWPNAFRRARFLSAVDHVQLDRFRRLVMQTMDEAMRGVEAVIGPSLTGPMLTITNYTGHPCVCIPSGVRASPTRGDAILSASGIGTSGSRTGGLHQVPHSICIWGGVFDEAPMLAAAAALERAFAFGERRPPGLL